MGNCTSLACFDCFRRSRTQRGRPPQSRHMQSKTKPTFQGTTSTAARKPVATRPISQPTQAPNIPKNGISVTGHAMASTAGDARLSSKSTSAFNGTAAPIVSLASRPSHHSDFSESSAHALFDMYRDANDDAMLIDGIAKFCDDMAIPVDDYRILVFAWRCKAETMCRFKRSEFMTGCKSLGTYTLDGIKLKLVSAVTNAQKANEGKEMYRWAYKFALDADSGQRTLPTDIAVLMWRLVFSLRKPAILDQWLAFLESSADIRGISKDTWDMFWNFAEQVDSSLQSYDDTEAWPSLFDSFVEAERERLRQISSEGHPLRSSSTVHLEV